MIPVSPKESLDLQTLVQRLREHLPQILRAHPVQLAYLYGSAAEDATTPFSDVDIALVTAQPLSAGESLNFDLEVQNELMHQAGIRNADVRLINPSSLLFRGQVLRDGVLLYTCDEDFRLGFETSTRQEYFDFKPVADQARHSLIARRKSGGDMVNHEKIETIILQPQEFLKHLRRLAQVPVDEFLNDPDKTGSARYYCVVAIETCIDICNHIISSKGFRAPSDYADIFRILGENQVFPKAFVQTLEQMAGFRNRLVHVYGDVNDRRIHEYLRGNLTDFDRFQDHILKFVGE
jgi:uncharacterized protein YutE (UPF0331/DUF86 family)/predicted nucleotidyltransferase